MAARAKKPEATTPQEPAAEHESIHAAMAAALAEVGPVAKSAHNAKHGYAARSIDDVMGAVQPVLARHGIFLRPEVRDLQRSEYQTSKGSVMQDTVATVVWHFAHRSGTELEVTMAGEGSDTGDKSTSKALAVALKYALLQTFCIPVGEGDPDNDTGGERSSRSRPPRGPEGATPPATRSSGSSADDRAITAPQAKRLWAKAHYRAEQVHADAETIVRSVYEQFGVERTQAITRNQYDAVVAAVEKWIPEDAGEAEPPLPTRTSPSRPPPEGSGKRYQTPKGPGAAAGDPGGGGGGGRGASFSATRRETKQTGQARRGPPSGRKQRSLGAPGARGRLTPRELTRS